MADWYGTARSNYVQIKDAEGLRKALEPFDTRVETSPEGTVFFGEGGSGGWPSSPSFGGGDDIEFDPAVHVCPFMEQGQVLVLMEAGAEKLRYVTGRAAAYDCKGKCVRVELADIYAKAAKKFGVPLATVSLAEY